MEEKVRNKLKETYESMKEDDSGAIEIQNMPKELKNGINEFETSVPYDTLKKLNDGLYARPDWINIKKLNSVLKRRDKFLDDGNIEDLGDYVEHNITYILMDCTTTRLLVI